MWDDLKLGVAHMKAWEKVVVVTDIDRIADATRLFGFAMTCPVKISPSREIAAATQWISSDLPLA
jgi:ribosomal protein S7